MTSRLINMTRYRQYNYLVGSGGRGRGRKPGRGGAEAGTGTGMETGTDTETGTGTVTGTVTGTGVVYYHLLKGHLHFYSSESKCVDFNEILYKA